MELSGGKSIDELQGDVNAINDVAGEESAEGGVTNDGETRSGTLKPRASRKGMDKGTKELDKQFGRLVVDEGKSRYGQSPPCDWFRGSS